MDLTMDIDEFSKSSVADEVNALRVGEFETLTNHYAPRIAGYGEVDNEYY